MTLRDCKYLIAYTLPLSAFLSLYLLGPWTFLVVCIAFVFIPIIEMFTPNSTSNFSPEEESELQENPFFDYLLYLHIPLLFGLLYYYFHTLTTSSLATYEIIGLTAGVGIIIGSFGINVGHELGHRPSKSEQFMAKLLLMPALYMHFFIEHNRGHHKNVATPGDPATARKGEILYLFWFRSTWSAYRNAWRLETNRLKRVGKSSFSLSNEMIWFQLVQLGYLLIIGFVFGWAMIPFAIATAVVGFLLLETVNYIEHYGLLRKKLSNGRYENVLPKHSWNANYELGRIFLYELTRHSDHHYKADRKYQLLRHMEDSPQLPFGYPTSVIIAMFPPLWFSLMNRRLPTM